ncbi:MAG TPA: hypothetical protein VIL74_09160 [Pyrinomonadaceae bacterium]|jgi:hypothetical protein
MAAKSIPNRKPLNKIGDKFGKLTIIAAADSLDKRNKTAWLCVCECGTQKVIRQSHLRTGIAKSCGCQRQISRVIKLTKHGASRSITYNSWLAMKQRCLNPKHKKYKNYGGRGITICERWLDSFEYFLADMGERPSSSHTIDRINHDGNYAPENCRWLLQANQQRNKSDNRLITINGETKCVSEWCEVYNVSVGLVSGRLKAGWTPIDAFTEPADRNRPRKNRTRTS